MRIPGYAIASLLLFASSGAAADEPRIEYQKVTELDFEDDTIQGDLTRPDGELVDAKRRVSHTNLIKIREEFRDQVLESVGEL